MKEQVQVTSVFGMKELTLQTELFPSEGTANV